MIKSRKKRSAYLWMALGILTIGAGWQWMAMLYGPLIVPSPSETLKAVFSLLSSLEGLADIYQTFYRCLIALLLLTITAVTAGMLAGFKPWLVQFLKPLNDILIAIPPVALTLLVIFLFGGGAVQTVAVAVALGFPLLYGATLTAVRSLDKDLLEMFRAYKISKTVQLWDGFLPAVIYAVLPNILLAAGLIVRLMVMAEIIVGMHKGIGPALSIARVHMATEELFAWLLIMAAAVLIIEGALLYLTKKHLMQWQAGR
ncbi:MAG TPA: hypothetical protein DCQ14_04000 [Firmicutes bacterium]|nr:hypothetical protein [Bacillota bacterium]